MREIIKSAESRSHGKGSKLGSGGGANSRISAINEPEARVLSPKPMFLKKQLKWYVLVNQVWSRGGEEKEGRRYRRGEGEEKR